MDFASSSWSTLNFPFENELDFSSLATPSTFVSFQEPNPYNPIIPCSGGENDGRQIVREATMTGEMTKADDEPQMKRSKHREIEKKRRQELTSLFKSLRYILPFQYIKGKRSSSDHVEEAVNYINDLQKKIKCLSEKRDQIKRSLASLSSTSSPSSLLSRCTCVGEDTHIAVKIRTCLVGMEIVASCCLKHEYCLSSILHVLAREQCFNVVSCLSTRVDQRVTHTIVSEVEGGKEVNLLELQEKIVKMC